MSIIKDGEERKHEILLAAAQAPEFEDSEEIKEELHRVENAKLQQLYLEAMLNKMTPVMELPLAEGLNHRGISP